jgi:thymidylate kinase
MAPLCRKIVAMAEESDEFHECVIRGHRELFQNELERVVLIDGRISVDAVEQQIWNSLIQRFPDVGKHQTSNIKLQTS